MTSPLVSIIIPVHNAEPWLATTLESVIHQTWDNLEVFVVDDGSKDGSLAIAQNYAASNIKVITQANQGASTARNHGLSLAQGDYIQYLDADDLLAPSKISDQVGVLESSPAETLGVCSTMHFVDGTDPDQGLLYDGLPFYADSDDPVEWLIRLWGGDGERGMVQPAAWLVPRSVSDRAGKWNPDLSLDDDGEYFARVILQSSGIRRSATALTYYRKFEHGSSLSRTNSTRGMWSGLNALNLKTTALLSQTDNPKAKQAIAGLYMDWAMTAYPLCPEVTNLALTEIKKLGVEVKVPIFGGKRMERMQQILGWKKARYLSWHLHQLRDRLLLAKQWLRPMPARGS